MLKNGLHLLRLTTVFRTLRRHRALFVFDYLPLPPFAGWLVKRLAKSGRADKNGTRPGARLAAAFEELGPSYIKLGQTLSVRADLVGEEVAADLALLRDGLPPFAAEIARASIAAELGRPVEDLFESFDDEAVAAASIAQVHFAVTTEGEEVAVKVLRPGVEAAFRRDLDLFFWMARTAERLVPTLRRLRPVAVVETLRESVEREMDLRLEAAAACELAENFAADETFRVPRIDWQRSGKRVLTAERVKGAPIDDLEALRAAGHDLPELAVRVIRVFLAQTLEHGFFHADFHHGNLFVAPEGTIVAVDFGIMGRLSRESRWYLAEILRAFVVGDWQRAAEAHFNAGYVPKSKSVEDFALACRAIGEPIRGRPVNEISFGRLLAQLFEVTRTFDMQTQPQLLLLQKTMVTTEGLARSLDPETNFWAASHEPVEAWLQREIGPEAIAQDLAAAARRAIEGLPLLAARIETALQPKEPDAGLRLAPETLAELAALGATRRRPLLFALWTVAALLAALLVLRLAGG